MEKLAGMRGFALMVWNTSILILVMVNNFRRTSSLMVHYFYATNGKSKMKIYTGTLLIGRIKAIDGKFVPLEDVRGIVESARLVVKKNNDILMALTKRLEKVVGGKV